MTIKIPFVNLEIQHQAIQAQLQKAIQDVISQDNFVLGKALAEFEAAFASAANTQYGIGNRCDRIGT